MSLFNKLLQNETKLPRWQGGHGLSKLRAYLLQKGTQGYNYRIMLSTKFININA